MISELKNIIRIETDNSNRLFYKYFVLLNLFLIIINLALFINSNLSNHLFYHILIFIFIIVPIGIIIGLADKPGLVKFLLIFTYLTYIMGAVLISGFGTYNIILLFSITLIGLFYISEKMYLISAISISLIIGIFTYCNETNEEYFLLVLNTLIIIIVLGAQYYGFKRIIRLLNNFLINDEDIFIDKLTGVYNKHYLKEKISNVSFDGQIQLSIISLNIDDFGQINKKYGANVGDNILHGFANIVQKILRNSDSICRNEGDDFVIIVQHPKEFEAETLAERIRKTLETQKFDIVDKSNSEVSIKITASFGVVSMEEHEGIDSLLKRGQDVLEMAKRNGKNRIEKA